MGDDPAFEIGAFAEPTLAAARAAFQWPRLARFNIGDAVSTRWARAAPDRPAIVQVTDAAAQTAAVWTYRRLDQAANRLANALVDGGLQRGDRLGVLLGQTPETAVAHIAAQKMGAVVVPLFSLFGADGLRLRAGDAGARAMITDAAGAEKLAAMRDALPALERVLSIDGAGPAGAEGFWATLERASDRFESVATSPEDPAFICYTSGTTGPPKGAVLPHRMLLGHLPGVQLFLDGPLGPSDVAWTPADWAWLGGLGDMLLPALYYGVPVVAHRMAKFDPERAFSLLARHGVTVSFMPPTALKVMRAAGAPADFRPNLRAVGSGGEALGAPMLDWGREALGLTIHEFYGQTECNLVTANNARLAPVKPGSIGPATPGFELAVLDADGAPSPPGAPGEIAVRRGAGSMFLGYWRNEAATAAKFSGDWLRTGDEGVVDADGYYFFSARNDDVISSAGYRIGPGEVEACLATHPAVAMAGVIGAPDPLRGEKVVAFVAPAPHTSAAGAASEAALTETLMAHVRARLSPHAAPREIRLIDALPLTATGKIMRRALRARYAAESPGEGSS